MIIEWQISPLSKHVSACETRGKLVHESCAMVYALDTHVRGDSAQQSADTSGPIGASTGASPCGSATGGPEKTITHAISTATLKQKPERVVMLFNGMVNISVALGGVSRMDWDQWACDRSDSTKNDLAGAAITALFASFTQRHSRFEQVRS